MSRMKRYPLSRTVRKLRARRTAKKELEKKSGKSSFAEQFYPARPKELWRRTRFVLTRPVPIEIKGLGPASASNKSYVNWLTRESMLGQANLLAAKYSGQANMWQNPYARPRPRAAVKKASVWFTAYPASQVTKSGQSILAALGEDELWSQFEQIGIEGLHTGPMKLAGGVDGWHLTPSIDGHFDRISTHIDETFGTEDEFRKMAATARAHSGIIIDDIIPGHTGKGFDFHLAEMNYRDYPGIYHMVEIREADWDLLPRIPSGAQSANLTDEQELALKKQGYIIGKMPRVIFYQPGVKETNWSATATIRGVDGKQHRWVYLHYFKAGQPSLNWLDPSFAAMKLVIGDALHSIGELGSSALRLDANGFLGIEKGDQDNPAWSEGHPLSEAANLLISGMVRKLGGFSFQELNLAIDDIKALGQAGADLSYDFINRPAYHHALATADTSFLRLMLNQAMAYGVDPASLVHAMQNHDDLTYELVHFWTTHKDDMFDPFGEEISGADLREKIRSDLNHVLVDGNNYNLRFTENGIACTSASLIASVLGIKKLDSLTAEDKETIKRAHLLLAQFNAWQPGVFALSGWDLAGALTLDAGEVKDLIADGDTRWINRGGFDLLGVSPGARASVAGLPLATSLYGPLPKQLEDPSSFASQLQQILAIRKKYALATAHQVDIPKVSQNSLLVMVHEIKNYQMQVTVLNFANQPIHADIASDYLAAGRAVTDMSDDQQLANVGTNHSFQLNLKPYQGLSLLVS